MQNVHVNLDKSSVPEGVHSRLGAGPLHLGPAAAAYLLGNLPQVNSPKQAGCRVCTAVLSGQAIVDRPGPRYNFAIS